MSYIVAGLVLGLGTTIASAEPDEPIEYRPAEPTDSVPHSRSAYDSGTAIDIGAGWMRVDPDGVSYRAKYLRFAPQASFKRWFYVGAAFEVGNIYGSSGTMNGMLPVPCTGNTATCTGPGNPLWDQSTGTIVEPQVFFGARDLVGIVSGSFEVAPTVRWTSSAVSFVNQTFTTTERTIEVHGRVDVWVLPRISAGIMVGSDFDTVRNLSAGLQIGFHYEPYDLMNRP
jgi:hypothetical protein